MIKVIKGDITTLDVDIVVNAANTSLMGGGGVDGAIHRAAGKELNKACMDLHGCETGDAKVTDGFKMKCQKIIHTVGPVFYEYDEQEAIELLESCYVRCIMLALVYQQEKKLDKISIAFPCISTGVYGFPKPLACEVAVNTVKETIFELELKDKLDVIFCCFEQEDYLYYQELATLN